MISASRNTKGMDVATKRPAAAPNSAGQLSQEQMRAALTKFERRINDLEAFDPQSLRRRGDPRLEALENKLTETISDVFGHGTVEFNRYSPSSLDQAGYDILEETPIYEVIQSVAASKLREITKLRTLIDLFNERLLDGDESSESRARRAFGDLLLHPEIERACSKLFLDGHYAEAIENACKVLDMLVKLRSMRTDPSGTELMQLVFSPKAPILKFNDQATDSEKSEQQGMMYLFAGAMLAIRNPRAHGLMNDHPESAVEYLSFLSMLAKSLDRAKT